MKKQTNTVTFCLDDELYTRLVSSSKNHSRNFSDMVRIMVRHYIAQEDFTKKTGIAAPEGLGEIGNITAGDAPKGYIKA